MRSIAKRLVAVLLCLSVLLYAPPVMDYLGTRIAQAHSTCDCSAQWAELFAAKVALARLEAELQNAQAQLLWWYMEINNAARALAIANQNLKIADSNLIQAKIEMGMAIGAYALAGMLVSSTFAAMLFTCGSPDPITKAGCPAAIRAFIGALAPLAAAKYAVEKVKNNLALVQAAYDAAVQAQKDAQAYYDGCCAMALVWEDIVESLEKQVKQAKIRVYNAQKAYDDCVAACSGG